MPEYVQQVPDVQLDKIYTPDQLKDLAWRAIQDAAEIMALPTLKERHDAYDAALKARPYMYLQRPFMQAFIQLALDAGKARLCA